MSEGGHSPPSVLPLGGVATGFFEPPRRKPLARGGVPPLASAAKSFQMSSSSPLRSPLNKAKSAKVKRCGWTDRDAETGAAIGYDTMSAASRSIWSSSVVHGIRMSSSIPMSAQR